GRTRRRRRGPQPRTGFCALPPRCPRLVGRRARCGDGVPGRKGGGFRRLEASTPRSRGFKVLFRESTGWGRAPTGSRRPSSPAPLHAAMAGSGQTDLPRAAAPAMATRAWWARWWPATNEKAVARWKGRGMGDQRLSSERGKGRRSAAGTAGGDQTAAVCAGSSHAPSQWPWRVNQCRAERLTQANGGWPSRPRNWQRWRLQPRRHSSSSQRCGPNPRGVAGPRHRTHSPFPRPSPGAATRRRTDNPSKQRSPPLLSPSKSTPPPSPPLPSTSSVAGSSFSMVGSRSLLPNRHHTQTNRAWISRLTTPRPGTTADRVLGRMSSQDLTGGLALVMPIWHISSLPGDMLCLIEFCARKRRSNINGKMKALQSVILHSNRVSGK
ncbi:unnamed protein product, partial [Urochloa humidicola]